LKTKEGLTALAFLAITTGLALFWLTGLPESGAGGPVPEEGTELFTLSAERRINALLDRNHLFIQLYGGVQRLAGRRVMEDTDPSYDVVRLSDGTLTFVSQAQADPALQQPVFSRLRDELSERNIPFLYVQAPSKLAPEDTRLPEGITDCRNRYADGLLAMLAELGIDTLDLRDAFSAAEGGWASWFFATDHHWTPQGAFLACQTLCGTLREDYGCPIGTACTDPDSFTRTLYQDWFLGSQGRRVGSLYGGVDDIEAWSPRFPTLFHYEVYSQQISRWGRFDETLMFYERVAEKDWYGGNPYTLYSGGDYPMARVTNYLHPDGPRILLLRDSFACALTPFLALGCSELSTFDLRYFGEDDLLLNYADWLKPDLVIMMYSAGVLHLDELLRF